MIKVLTGPDWLLNEYTGYLKGIHMIKPPLDADGDYYLSKGILNNPIYDFTIPTKNPNTGEIKPLVDWLWEKDFNPIVDE